MPADPQTPSSGGRFEYLGAIQEHWPEVLSCLCRDVFPLVQPYLQRSPDGEGDASELQVQNNRRALEKYSQLDRKAYRTPSLQLIALQQAVLNWADRFGMRDQWILDAAVQSLRAWDLDVAVVGKWVYVVPGLQGPPFQPKLGTWMPYFTTWPEFKKNADTVYRRELKRYRSDVSTRWGEGHPKLSAHACWTVLWQKGKSPEAIRNSYRKMQGREMSVANIQMCVHAFARSIELTLREAKAGRKAKI